MLQASKLTDEPARLAALHRYQVLDVAPEAPFDRITALVKSLMAVPIATVTLVDAHRQWFLSRQGICESETPREVSFCTHTIRGYDPMVVQDARIDPRFRDSPVVTGSPHIVTYVGIPLQTPDGYNIGALCVIDTVRREFSQGQIDVLKSFAPLVIGELELRLIAQTDPLTGALSRRGLLAQADTARARLERHGRPAALVLFDVDHFKQINDTHGHPTGDTVLQALVNTCRALLREGDVLGRIGGEEFAILLNESNERDGALAAERFRQAVEAMVVEHDPPLQVTASFGIATIGPDFASSEAWMAEADLALYAAKAAGRNCCQVAAAQPQSAAA